MANPKTFALLLSTLLTTVSCIDTASLAVKSTAKVLERAAPAMEQEPDFLLAKAAMPGGMKTIEGFHRAQPDNPKLQKLLAKSFCSYAAGFIEDDYELAGIAGDLEGQRLHASRAAKAFTRCLNYGLMQLPKSYRKKINAEEAPFLELVAKAKWEHRDALMWTGFGLAGFINYNKTDIGMVTHLPKALAILHKVVALDDKHNNKNVAFRALPHMALGRAYTSRSKFVGGDPPKGQVHFKRALEISGGRMLLIKVYYAAGFARITANRTLFRKLLMEVLKTDPAIWPKQRLANEIAHRRARRYLKQEKEWF